MKKRRRLKKGVRNILYAIIFSAIFIFVFSKFDLWNRIESMFITNDVKFGKIYVEKPKVQIVNEESNTRPIAVSINNNHDAYPHSGLQDAYLGYELIAEGGITRLLAFFKDANTKKIGSVRSARHYFLDYVMENEAIFVHYGWSPQAKEDVSSLKINNLNGLYDSSVFYRDTSLKKAYEHTAFTTMEKINKGIKSKKYNTTSTKWELLNYSPVAVDYSSESTYKDAKKVTIKYSDYHTTKYVYDEENKVYKMYMGGKEHIDRDTNKQYTVKNIITYQVENSTIGAKGRQDLDNLGHGEGYYISNGKSIKIKWTKAGRSEKTKYTLMNGNDLVVNDGNTWIHIQPKGKTLTIE